MTKHRQAGYKIKTTRFVIPRIRTYSGLDWDAIRMLRDFDHVFSLLEGKAEPEIGLESVQSALQALARGERLEGSHFGVKILSRGDRRFTFFRTRKEPG